MSEGEHVGYPIGPHRAAQIEGFDALAELALNMRWSWNHATDEVWRRLDPELWEITHNPWVVLQAASRDQIEHVMAEPGFRKNVDGLLQTRRTAIETPAWFQQKHPQSSQTCVAYFSMEFMLSEALPIYSGGLGNVAGDQLKAASDLGVPVVGVGLLYQRGYFRQEIDRDGAQQALFPYNDPGQLPITPLRETNGEWLRLEIALPGYSVWLRAWQVQVGRAKLYLLDSNDAANFPAHRGITSELYGGGPEVRLKQEMLLGIGGWRLLDALGIRPEVCHLNEGHAAFAVLERARSFMHEAAQPFEVALAVTRAGNVFTTHTGMALLTPRFSADRTVREYTEQRYLPAASTFRERAATNGAEGRKIVDWQHALERTWGGLRFGEMRVTSSAEHHEIEVEIFLNGLDPDAVRVELFAEGINGGEAVREEMRRVPPTPQAGHVRVYQATVPPTRPASDYTPRVVSQRPGVAVPLESNRILWRRR